MQQNRFETLSTESYSLKPSSAMDEEFETFFKDLRNFQQSGNNDDTEKLLKPLKILLWTQKLKSIVVKVLIITTICSTVYCVESLNWLFCAIGKLAMIKILPYWDWKPLETAKCLIAREINNNAASFGNVAEFNWKNCRACQNFDAVDALKNVDYQKIYEKFLIRGLPVIVKDSVPANVSSSVTLKSFLQKIKSEMSKIISSEPCSLETNMMMTQYAQLERIISLLEKRAQQKTDGNEKSRWFVSFRNCDFNALKASRLMIEKPYFYPRSLQAPASSWILISEDFVDYTNDLSLVGLVMVTQIKGSLDITLIPRRECSDFCQGLNMKLFEGESLVFLHHLWKFSYRYVAEKGFTLTFITETDFYD